MIKKQENSEPKRPLAIDLYAGLGGWSDGFLAEGYTCVGFDIELHDYGTGGYPGQLVLQDVMTLHGSQFKDAVCIVASPPCQFFSYCAMPWSRAKELARKTRADETLMDKELALFRACFRIQREACEAAGRHIPMVVENVRGAQPWVGRAAWNFGSYYLWGDVPALMPLISRRAILKSQPYKRRHGTGSWFAIDMASSRAGIKIPSEVKTVGHANKRDGYSHTRHLANPAERDGVKQGGDWFGANCESSMPRRFGSKSTARKAASAQIAKIPFALAQHIARVYKPAYTLAIGPGAE
jgi:hypothetical protein